MVVPPLARATLAAFVALHVGLKLHQLSLGERDEVAARGIAGLLQLGGPFDAAAPLPAAALHALEVAPLGGARTTLGELLRGHPVAVVAFFETWCQPCRHELPQLQALQRELGPQGLAVVGVYADSSDADVRQLAQELQLTLPLVRDVQRRAGRLGVDAVPTTVVLGAGGAVLQQHRGEDPLLRAVVLRALADAAEGAL
jgi:thiol-disulfide isomerase/thioredoxin